MVRVWYEPPPFGPGTDLNRSGYGMHGGGLGRKFLERASKMPQTVAIGVPVVVLMVLAWVPLRTSIRPSERETIDHHRTPVSRFTFAKLRQ
jgi:hypothetical protein